ncbi:hypothetical protein [Paraburkholderia adhaesiva]|uniref:hypothetical protein n=1 Tax=Paraburkholderia adhaesiva TaxID=2883244 RepID=UPI001F29A6B3|nr:hypothetical protein [Paraburkholderia adhaesiva]
MVGNEGLDLHAVFSGPHEVDQSEWRVLMSLRSFQIIESVLKSYLCRANPAAYQATRVIEWPLGTLIKHFVKVGGRAELVSMLQAVRTDRNLIAHQALVCLDGGLAGVIGADPVSLARLKEIDRRAMKAMGALVGEYVRTATRTSA